MKPEKLALWVINFLLSALLAFAVLVLMERLPALDWPWYSRSLCCAPMLICFPAGLFATRRSKGLRLALGLVVCLGSAAASFFLLPGHSAMDLLYLVLSLVVAVGLYFLGLRGNEPFMPKAAIASILLYLFICIYYYLNSTSAGETGAALQPMTYCALANFLLSLYSFNAYSLRGGLHNVKGTGNSFAVPSGMRSRNLLMLTIFLVIAVPIASLGFLHQGLGALASLVLGGIWKVISFLAGGEGDSSTPPPVQQIQEEREPEDRSLPDVPVNTTAQTIVIVFIIAMLVLGVIVLIAVLAGNGAGRGRFSLKRFFRRFHLNSEEADYEDSVERTLDLKGILKEKREQLGAFFSGLTARPERFEDMPDGRMKLRFVYKSLLNSSRVNERAKYCTPSELGAQLKTPELEALAEEYNAARYRLEAPVPADAADTAEKALTALRRGKRK